MNHKETSQFVGQVEAMLKIQLDIGDVERETMLSSGPGGQNVNKVESGVRLRFDISSSDKLTEEQKSTLFKRLGNKLTEAGELLVSATDTRSQLQNTEIALEKLNKILNDALKPRKKRIKTKPTKSSEEKRRENKERQAEKKRQRKKPEIPPVY